MTDHDERMHSCLYSNDGRVELCERICKLEGLVLECLSTVCGWAWTLNELKGYDKLEEGTVPTNEFRRLQALARELEVPNA